MSCKDIFNGSTGNRATFLILNADGLAKTGVAWNAAGLVIAYKIDTGSQVAITLSSSNWYEIGGGKYYVDVIDDVYLAANLGKLIQFYGTLTDSSVYGEQHRVVGYNPSVLPPTTDDIATAVVEKAVSSGNPVGSVGYILHAISTMIEYVGGLWRFKSTAVSEVAIPAQNGDWAITRTFQVSGGDKVSGVRMSLVGVAGKTDTTGTDGIAVIKADDGTFTLRVVVPAGYEDVADTTVVVSGADSTATVTLVATTVTQAAPPLCAVVLPVVDQYGAALAGVGVMIRFVSFAALASPDAVVMSPPPVLTSNGSGLVTVNLMRLANYEAFYAIDGAVKRVDFSVPDAGAFIVVEAN